MHNKEQKLGEWHCSIAAAKVIDSVCLDPINTLSRPSK
jgi:hypothetical protein